MVRRQIEEEVSGCLVRAARNAKRGGFFREEETQNCWRAEAEPVLLPARLLGDVGFCHETGRGRMPGCLFVPVACRFVRNRAA